jgi:FkbM family methyltransferase
MEFDGSAIESVTVRVGGIEIRVPVRGDLAFVPASLKSPNGHSRFSVSFPKELASADQGAKYLIFREATGGYEPPTRNLLERLLRPGDLFIDVGAHWGFFTLQAATHLAGNVTVIAVEPDPTNAGILLRNIANHGLSNTVSVVCAACGRDFDLAPLVTDSSMMHSIRGVGLKGRAAQGPAHWVSVISLDAVLARFPESSDRRVILKIDAEGFEPAVIEGATELLKSGRLAIIIWESGEAFLDGLERDDMLAMVDSLNDHGFCHLRPASQDDVGPLAPFFKEEQYLGNVFSYRPDMLSDISELPPLTPDSTGG